MMKILEVCTESSPAYALVFKRAQALNQQHVELFTIDILCSAGKEVSLMRQQGMSVVISTLHRSLRPLALLRSLYNLHQILRQQEYQIIHLHFGVPGLVGRLLAIIHRRPIWVYQSHGYSLSANTGWLARSTYLITERLLKHTVDFALFQSEEDVALALRYKLLHPAQMRYLGNGIDTERFRPQTHSVLVKNSTNLPKLRQHANGKDGLSEDTETTFVFGMVARFESIKNHQLLLDAIKHLRLKTIHFKVLLIGQGERQEAIEAQIAAHELYQWVEIIPYSHDMPTFYQRIDMALLTSFGEGLPRALLEPMACGKPVICSDVKGSREAVVDQETGFILPLGQPECWAEKMRWCIEHQDELQPMGQAARQRVATQFTEQQVITRLGRLYEHCHHLNKIRHDYRIAESST